MWAGSEFGFFNILFFRRTLSMKDSILRRKLLSQKAFIWGKLDDTETQTVFIMGLEKDSLKRTSKISSVCFLNMFSLSEKKRRTLKYPKRPRGALFWVLSHGREPADPQKVCDVLLETFSAGWTWSTLPDLHPDNELQISQQKSRRWPVRAWTTSQQVPGHERWHAGVHWSKFWHQCQTLIFLTGKDLLSSGSQKLI